MKDNFMGNRAEHAIASAMAMRAIASLSFSRPTISDTLRQVCDHILASYLQRPPNFSRSDIDL